MGDATDWPETDRVLLRPWVLDDADRLLDIRRREHVAKWLSDPTPWTELATAQEKIRGWGAATLDTGPLGVWAIVPRDDHTPIGSVSIGQLPGSDEIEIGWYLHPDSGGRGYAAEAARALLDHTLARGVARVWAIMWPHNEPSARVAASIGMLDLGVVTDPWYGTDVEPTSRIFRAGPAEPAVAGLGG
jgi:RimJ/RimL family protein N-acetyltransferase